MSRDKRVEIVESVLEYPTVISYDEYDISSYVYDVEWCQEDNKYLARCREIPGCTGTGATEQLAITDAMDTVNTHIKHSIDLGILAPLSMKWRPKSGEYVVEVYATKSNRALRLSSFRTQDKYEMRIFMMQALTTNIHHMVLYDDVSRTEIHTNMDISRWFNGAP